jgi:hypothetical protein
LISLREGHLTLETSCFDELKKAVANPHETTCLAFKKNRKYSLRALLRVLYLSVLKSIKQKIGIPLNHDPRCCGTGTCLINLEGICWCGQIWDGEKMCMPNPSLENNEPLKDSTAQSPVVTKIEETPKSMKTD